MTTRDDLAAVRRRARRLLREGSIRAADRELRRAIDAGAADTETLILAAEVAGLLSDHARQIDLLGRASRSSNDPALATMLVDALLGAGLPARAEGVLDGMRDAPPALTARVLRALGRTNEAISTLEVAARKRPHDEETLVALFDALETVGDEPALCGLLDTVRMGTARVALRAARCRLRLGDFAGARAAASALTGPDALAVTLVAAAMLGDENDANDLCSRLQAAPEPPSAGVLVDAWRRGLTAVALAGGVRNRERGPSADKAAPIGRVTPDDVPPARFRKAA